MPRQTPPVARGPSSHRLVGLVGSAALACEQVCSRFRGVPYDICLAECRRHAGRIA
ncbi:hypothetical protein [Phreatobacter sp.]|uniref:hypothetical protein n=1 Tax=Phreatobacter sp. TaxID=1966341 RepID=UPI003F71DBCF